MQAKSNRYVLMLALLLFIGLGCNLFSGISERYNETKATAEHVATQVQEGREMVATVQGLATEVGESGLLATVQAVATDVDESGLYETAQAFATEQGPVLLGTARAIATQEGPGMIATIQALATDFSESLGEAPADIPIVGGEIDNLIESSETVSYITPLPFDLVLGFYKNEMPLLGWAPVETGTFEAEHTAVLHFDKPDRRTSITLTTNPLTDQTIVLVTIQPK